jgi:hypothetical protein
MSRYASEAEKAEVHNFTSRSEQALHKRFREQLAQWKDDSPEAIEHREKMQATARANVAQWAATEILRAIPFVPRLISSLEWERACLRRSLAAIKPKKKRATRKKRVDATN